MKNLRKLFFILALGVFGCLFASAQSNQANDLIKQGVDLHNQGKFAEAIDKFNEALKIEPNNPYANYEISFSFYAAKKPKDAIPHLEKAVKSDNVNINVASYCLLASIYDEDNQSAKAIENYNLGIKLNPDYPQIYYNLGITYSRAQQYTEAENAAIEAIKHNPKNASSQRLYALVELHQNKRVQALLAFCNFILLEPGTARSAETYGNIMHIMQGGVITDAKGNSTIQFSAQDDKETGTLNLGLSFIITSSKAKNLTGTDLLEDQLKSIFSLAGQLSEKKTDKTFFDKFYADYFYKLAQSPNMPALAHTIALTANKDESAKWAKDNMDKIKAMGEWLGSTDRGF